ncbi:PEP-CTERM sorting domain-containing protein [Colwellia psychrerythraea]|uniref:PEP motif putative anchor domain protein n=1 Tax=Colwellia psychrerythraea TaxID=28229 RepID=A0A099KL41_COLPS|nr:PEP-CTERM sorting domain-containing protein [Colwellia psychrerythraea]KGJ90985.1 PEP motif putative anchor domain protein [Colwellia psychrerythraea]
MKITLLPLVILIISLTFLTPTANASLILGTGTGALIGGDLTDPENDGFADSNVNYNATFSSSVEQGFGGGEYAFNVFDNILSGGNGKWCCDGGSVWVEANFGSDQYILDIFTLSSANDVASRDSDQWSILGSNDGINYTTLFAYDIESLSIWGADRFEVVQFSNNDDYHVNTAYSIFRYQSTSVVSGSHHQLGEIEFFGTKIPEPSSIAIFALAMMGLSSRRISKKP